MLLSELDYNLPKELIAQSPTSPRDHSRLMVINRETGKITHKHFYDLVDLLTPNDVLVLNKTKVFPARVFGKKETGGKVEILLLKNLDQYKWEILTKPGIKTNQKIIFEKFECQIKSSKQKIATAKFNLPYLDLLKAIEKIGHIPLPPYIHSKEKEEKLRRDYQTVYAKNPGSAAAPTAGLHFTNKLLKKLKEKGIQMESVTLHVGLGTFEPVKENNLENHKIHEEYFEADEKTYKRIIKAKKERKRIIAVGTTTARVLESFPKILGYTKLFIYPPYKFKIIDGLITNFHLPKSTLLALVFAFLGQSKAKDAYKIAIKEKYRFFSFGDSMFITK